MSLVLRPPLPAEWRVCRLLLPEAFASGVAPEALIAWDDERATVAGAAAFHQGQRESVGTQVRTVRTHRRRGVGSRLLAGVVERARERGDQRVAAYVDVLAQPEAAPFLAANGFQAGPWTVRLEGRLEPVRETVLRWRERLVASGKAPASARVVDSRELPADALEAWYRQTIAPALHGRPEYAAFILSAPSLERIVLLVDGLPAGMAAGVRNDGTGIGTLAAVAVAPEHRGGWGWANLLLMASAFDRAWEAGAHGLRFETEETNWRVLQSAGRVQAVTIGRSARFVREIV